MFKDYAVKNPSLSKTLKDKWITRSMADSAIPKNRMVEVDASTGDVEVAGLDSVRVIGVNPDTARVDGNYFNCELGPVEIEAGSVLVAGQKAKCGTAGKAIAFIDVSLINTEIATEDGVAFTNQPDEDTVDVESSSASDVTQKVTLYGIDTSDAYISEELTLTGTTPVSTTSALWKAVCGIVMDSACVGTMKVTENSGGATIKSFAVGELTHGIVDIVGGYAYNAKATIVGDGATTGQVILVHEATDGASETNLVAQLNGAVEVALSTVSYKINTWMVGNVASDVNLDLDVTATEDNLKLAVGKVLVGSAVGSDAIVNLL